MTVTKPFSFTLPTPRDVMSFVLARFSAPTDEVPVVQPKTPSQAPEMEPLMMDRTRYVRLLENELDRQHLTAVEREDTDTLDRVRAALYQA